MGTPEFCFVSGAGGSVFMDELLDVVADAVQGVGGHVRTAVGSFPEPTPNTVYVIVPHEYFVLVPQEKQPAPELLARTIGFCVEHPGNLSFERTAQALPRLAFGVDINTDSTAELRRRGNRVEQFQLGYSPLWDHWGGDLGSSRAVDVTYLGTEDTRRSRLLASYWRDLDDLNVRLLTPPHEMMGPPRVDFLPGVSKFQHLANSRFLINLHRGRSKALEWVRVLEALSNGCVVLTEHSPDIAPLIPGEHLISARPETLGAIAATMTGNQAYENELRVAGYEFIQKGLDLPGSATMLIELASELVSGVTNPAPHTFARLAAVSHSPSQSISVDTPSWDVTFAPGPQGVFENSNPEGCAMAVDRTRYARRAATRSWVPRNTGDAEIFPDTPRSTVDVLIVQRPGESDPQNLIGDLHNGTVVPRQVLLGRDGVTASYQSSSYEQLIHEFPLGRGYTRNALLTRAEAPWTLVLDSDMRASSYLLERLTAQIDHADVVHCLVGDPVVGLVGALPAEAHRLLRLPYLGGGYLIRRALLNELGNWPEDPLLDGLEDHVLWRRIAAKKLRSTLVQQVLLHRARAADVTRPLDLDPGRVWSIANSAEVLHGT